MIRKPGTFVGFEVTVDLCRATTTYSGVDYASPKPSLNTFELVYRLKGTSIFMKCKNEEVLVSQHLPFCSLLCNV